MATLKWKDDDGSPRECEVATDWRIGELVEAENALGFSMEGARAGVKMALVVFISRRRVEKERRADALADEVLRMDFTKILPVLAEAEEEERDRPPEEGPGEETTPGEEAEEQESAAPLTTGRLRSAG